MSICYKYVVNKDVATEVVNDGFLKVYKHLCTYQASYEDVAISFSGWFKKIMINTSIDYFRKNKKYKLVDELNVAYESLENKTETSLEKLSHDEIMKVVHTLSPGYRLVFNLYVLEGMNHIQIAETLNISEGTSKSNLSKARGFLQKKLVRYSL